MLADADAVCGAVLTVKVALVAPAATVTLAGTVAAAVLPLVSVTTAPPDGAALASVAVPCELPPPATVAGLSVIAESTGAVGAAVGVTVRTADFVTPPPVTEMVTGVVVVTGVVKMLNPPVVLPAGIRTALGTSVATVELLTVTCRVSSVVPAAAMVTVAKEPPLCPTVVVGLSVIDVGGCCGTRVT